MVGYEAGGSRDEGSTIWYGRLRNGEHRAMAGASSIVHTGDILTGQRGAGGLVDQERIYIWLPQLPDRIAALAVAADVYTAGISFYSLSEAYVRLVNADTEQELARLTLTSRHLGDAAEGRVMLLARLRRLADAAWSLDATAEPRQSTLREESHMPPAQAAAVPPAAAVAVAAAVAEATPVAVATAVAAPPAAAEATGAGGSAVRGGGGGGGGGGGWCLCPALAVGTAAGVAAATAIFTAPQLDMAPRC